MTTPTQQERLTYLLDAFKQDSGRYRDLAVADDYEAKRITLRGLMNIRMPRPMPGHVLAVQDDFLQQEAREKGIVAVADIPTMAQQGSCHPLAERLSLWQGDITRLAVDAIVNAANSQMLGCFVPNHRCIDNAIHSAAGIQLREECSRIMRIQGHEEPTGTAKLTRGYNLPARYVLHTVGPIVYGQLNDTHRAELAACYRSCLELAAAHGLQSVAFCCISTGEFHFPNEEAAEIAVQTVAEFLRRNEAPQRVVFNVFKDLDRKIYERLLA